MPVAADQKPTTGTRAIVEGVGVRVGVGVGVGSGARVAVAVFVGFGSGVGDGVGAQDTTMAAIITALNHRRAIRDARMGQA
jgi:hypothetical protein